MANNYLQPVNDYFSYGGSNRKLEDVDDDTFLSSHRSLLNAKARSQMGGLENPRSTNPFEEETDNSYPEVANNDPRQTFEQRKREIEERTLNSTQKSLHLLYDTEEVGKATAFELSRQREQLEKTSRNLDEINATLRFSQRHLNGLKSVFGSLKNYLAGNRDMPPAMANKLNPKRNALEASAAQLSVAEQEQLREEEKLRQQRSMAQYDNHPIARIRNDSSMYQQRATRNNRSSPFEAQLEANLEEMCGNLSRLKGLATDMTREIESQNELLDNMNYKIEDVDLKMNKQNKDILKLLGKK